MTLAETIITYLREHGPTSTRALAVHIGRPPNYLSMTLTRLKLDRFIRVAGKESHSNVWAIGPRTDYKPGRLGRQSKRGMPTTPKAVKTHMERKEKAHRIVTIERQIKAAKRDHAARNKDEIRDSLADDVEAYLARGGSIEVVPGYRDAPPVTRVRAYEGGWS